MAVGYSIILQRCIVLLCPLHYIQQVATGNAQPLTSGLPSANQFYSPTVPAAASAAAYSVLQPSGTTAHLLSLISFQISTLYEAFVRLVH